MKNFTATQYAEIISNKISHMAHTIARQDGREAVETDFSAAMIMTFAEEMTLVMNRVSTMAAEQITLH
ncbi:MULTISPECIES: hypothetical protein [Bacillales]|uniref:hypothetical protein n=1 Tax=Bacillales TaxID=1385 RepID=UPI000807EDED|nr:hypothetical protein [Bacillus sp. FJAT-27264]OBZ11878.1 hypothetical protein A8L34_16280 [Bacillus sp. FJAT-27264]